MGGQGCSEGKSVVARCFSYSVHHGHRKSLQSKPWTEGAIMMPLLSHLKTVGLGVERPCCILHRSLLFTSISTKESACKNMDCVVQHPTYCTCTSHAIACYCNICQSSYPAEVQEWNFYPIFSAKDVVKFGVKFWWNFPRYVFQGLGVRRKISPKFHVKNGVKNGKFHANFTLPGRGADIWCSRYFTPCMNPVTTAWTGLCKGTQA